MKGSISTPTDILPSVLVIEDDPQIRRFLRTTLSAEQYHLHEATTAAEGLAQATKGPIDAIILDLGLPDEDGLSVIRSIRRWSQNLPIIVLSVRVQERDKVAALDAGADDFVTKPFAVGELLARLRAALRRSTAGAADINSAVFRTGELEVDLIHRRVLVAGKEIHLTRIEYKILTAMVHYADRVLTHSQLLNEVWGPNYTDQLQYIRVYMAQLRRKLEPNPAQPRYLCTEPGVGYRLTTESGT